MVNASRLRKLLKYFNFQPKNVLLSKIKKLSTQHLCFHVFIFQDKKKDVLEHL